METEKLNLYQKLIEIRKQVLYVKKDDKAYNYKYTKPSKLIGMLRPKMDELGVILSYDILDTELSEIERYQKGTLVKIGVIKAKFVFEWINAENPKERITKTITTMIRGDDVADIGSLSTYSLRYFLLGFFNIPNDTDDPDTHDKALARDVYRKEEKEGKVVTTIDKAEQNRLQFLFKELNVAGTYKEILKKYGIKTLSELPEIYFDGVCEVLGNRIEMAKTGEK